ncbi:MAG: putative lipid II flippase FtsW [Firmicutes bacterium]|nr:putative lipid II flippase FtsW [Bacillota bacterium]
MRKKSIDWFTLIPVLLLLCIGIIMVLSASSPTVGSGENKDVYRLFKKQLGWVGVGLVIMFISSNYHYRKLKKHVVSAAVVALVSLVLVFGFEAKNGAHSWIIIGGNQFQPSEFVKLCLILILSQMISRKGRKMSSLEEGLFPALVVIGIVCGLVLMEPDLGTTMVIAITSFIMLFAGGASIKHLGALALAGIGAAAAAIAVAPYRVARVFAFIDPFKDPRGIGYQITQSLYAIGSGGLMGVGLGRSMQKYFYIPEQHTDFIFSILSEELGFIGATFVIFLFILFAARGYRIAKNSKDDFGCLLACGITSMILVEGIINIAVVTSSMPVTGITLPFISYGGSSLIFKMAAVGVLLNISKYMNDDETYIMAKNVSKT